MPYSVRGYRILFRYQKNELIDKLKRRKGHNLQAMKEMENRFKERLFKSL